MLLGACSTHQVAKAVWIVPRLDKCECLDKLSSAFTKHGSFQTNLHTISKNLMLEDGDGSFWEDPCDTISSSATTTASVSEGPPCHHKIECASTAGDKAIRASGCRLPDELDKASKCALCGVKTRLYFVGCFNEEKLNQVMPLCQVKRHSSMTNKKQHQTCMILWHANIKRGLTKLNNRCASASDKNQRVST